ncbi:segregation and condensation protein A [Paenibacillus pini JCM 16418]|uniref:Segregation and condensation protein A n=1 Tax=Paenibacillus pini JCM 16418 TaxID=1236976 RepID=W7Z3D9_9BACL|nr:segregation and condensation protein A [Paenibacillus pini JCM 16418]
MVQKLIEYRKYKGIAKHLQEKEMERSLIYSKEPEDLTPWVHVVMDNPVKGLHAADLLAAFQKAIRKATKRTSYARIQRDEISVKDRIREVLTALERNGPGSKLLFSRLLHEDMIRHEIVVTFLAILELMKMKQILCYQEKLFDDIVMEWTGGEPLHGISEVEINY